MRAQATRLRSLPLAVLGAALACALAGCGGASRPATNGPLSSAGSWHGPIPRGSECAPGGRPVAFGFQQFTNYGDTTVTLDRVVLLHPHNEQLVGSDAVPGAVLVGEVYWPPKYPGTPAGPGLPAAWDHRQPVRNYRLAPGRTFNMVLGVAAISPARATSRGMLVYYHDSTGSYIARNFWANNLAAASRKHGCA